MDIKTSDLIGAPLDWAVAKAICPESFKSGKLDSNGLYPWCTGWLRNGSPSADWSQGGPLIERFEVAISPDPYGWHAEVYDGGHMNPVYGYGSTALIAACLSIVAYKLGDTVTVPDELEG